MKKRNLIIQAAVIAAFGAVCLSANAGTLATAVVGGTLFAAEDFGTYTAGITPGAATYTVGTTNGIVVNAGGKIYVTVRLTNGTFKSGQPVGGVGGDIAGTAIDVGGAGNGVVGTPVVSTDKTTAMIPITYTAGVTLGVGSTFMYTPTALAIEGVTATLATAGNTVSATVAMSAIAPVVQAPSTTTSPNTGTAIASDIDAPAATAVIAKSAQGVTTAISALPAYTGKIDLTATPPASRYVLADGTLPANAALGSVTFTNAATAANQYDGTTTYTIAKALTGAGANKTTVVVTPGTGQAFPIGAKLSYGSTSCTTPLGALTAFTAATSVTPATLIVADADIATATALFVCLSTPSTGNVAAPITATIKATLGPLAATYVADTATATGYSLTYNGSQSDIRTYVPAGAAGYTSYVRVINTGAVSAAVNVAVIDPVTGTASAAVSMGTLAAGAATTLSSTQVEALAGFNGGTALVGTSRPRLRFTAPTNGMTVQSFLLTNANGNFSLVSGGE